jgi:hypothetical protein
MTDDVVEQVPKLWPMRCTKCDSDVVTKTKECWQVCDNCGRLWVAPVSVGYAIGAGMVPGWYPDY